MSLLFQDSDETHMEVLHSSSQVAEMRNKQNTTMTYVPLQSSVLHSVLSQGQVIILQITELALVSLK